LVTSFRPLKVWLYDLGFGRFCSQDYTLDMSQRDNKIAHITNNAVQRTFENYDSKHGSKLSLSNIFL